MIIGIWGEDKSCKSTLALTGDRPIGYMELDLGGYRRATRNVNDNLPIADWVRDKEIFSVYKDMQGTEHEMRYVMPMQQVDIITATIRPTKILTGMKELFFQWLVDYMNLLKMPEEQCRTIVIDTGTLLRTISSQGYLQEKQELQMMPNGQVKPGEKLRVQLMQQEYREPNDRMRAIFYQANAYRKNLIITHHATDKYALMPGAGGIMQQQPTGKRKMQGWDGIGDSADIIVHTYITAENVPNTNPPKKKIVPRCEVDLCEVKELEGMKLVEPTIPKLTNMIKMIRGEV